MSLSKDPTIRDLNECGCCEGTGFEAPREVYNRGGLPAIDYRIGTHASFLETLLARLSGSDLQALRQLRTRDRDDFTIALLDAWAVVADILTFYQERIANESYLRTAIDTTSLYGMARLIGYKPKPGVAASTYLAFVLEEAAGNESVVIPRGARALSLPGPGEKPQVFETVEEITAKPEWNAILPRLSIPQELKVDMQSATIRGLAADIRAGDPVLIVAGSGQAERDKKAVVAVRKDNERQTTRLDFQDQPLLPKLIFKLHLPAAAFAIQPLKLTSSIVSANVLQAKWKQADLAAQAKVQKWPVKSLVSNIIAQKLLRFFTPQTGIYPLERAQVFGHNAPAFVTISTNVNVNESNWDSPARTLAADAESQGFIYLDNVYRGAVKDAFVVLESPTKRTVHKITAVSEKSRAAFTLSGKVTRIQVSSANELSGYGMRETTVWLARSEPLDLADLPVTEDVPAADAKNSVILDRPYVEIASGQNLILTGERTDLAGVVESELVTVADVEIADGDTRLTFTRDLKNTYKRGTVRLNANVALATHGETATEVLGSGDAGVPFQSFKLRQPPLTYVSARNPSGAESTMEIRVGGLLYQEVRQLYGSGPDDRVYSLRQTSEGDTWVEFGDGINGARLPTGLENVTATYRKGMGEAGLVRANQLSLLVVKPQGVKSVLNPIAATGAASPEGVNEVRQNAALPLISLDRIVSLRDYESFARAFSGISKALATWMWDGRKSGVFLTIAGPKRSPDIEPSSQTHTNLVAAIAGAAAGRVSLIVKSYRAAFFRVEGKVKVDSAYEKAKVLASVASALTAAFDYDRRSFGQAVTLSEVTSVMHQVPGVLAVDIDFLYRTGESATRQPTLTAALPQTGVNEPLAAELLLIDPRPIPLVVMS